MGKVQVAVLSKLPPKPPSRLKRFLKRFLKPTLVVLALVVLVVLAQKLVKVKAYLEQLQGWIETHKAAGVAILPLLIWVMLPLCFPCSLFEIAAGSLFGIPVGVVVSVVGKTGGGVLAFLVGRYFLRRHLGAYLQTRFRAFRVMCEVLQSCDWKPLFLVQISGLPNALKCYGLAITSVPLWRFALTAFVGGIPYSLVWTFIGKQTQNLLASTATSAKKKVSAPQLLLMVAGIVLTLLALATLTWYTKKLMHEHQQRAKVASFVASPQINKGDANLRAAADTTAVDNSISETESVGSTD
ncbi:Membrane protein [Globisporangium polare]